MSSQIDQVIAISVRRYNETSETQAALARAYHAITHYARDEQRSRNDARALLRFLNRPHADPNLTKACKDV